MNALFEAAREVCEFMTARRWKFCIKHLTLLCELKETPENVARARQILERKR